LIYINLRPWCQQNRLFLLLGFFFTLFTQEKGLRTLFTNERRNNIAEQGILYYILLFSLEEKGGEKEAGQGSFTVSMQ